jgi:beta-N-acetylhexosaminidase
MAPYYVDPTDISKFTAYYALYSKQPAFVEVAARLLFREQVTLEGASPVTVPAVDYDLRFATSPDENQIIPLALDQAVEATPTSSSETPATEAQPTQTLIPLYRIGDTITVRAGPIFDHNNHIVPDKTPVRFTMTTRDETGEILQPMDSETEDGVARASFAIDRPGTVEIRAVSEPALESVVLQFDASNEGAVVITVVPTFTATIETPQPTSTPVVVDNGQLISLEGYPRVGMWLLVMLAIIGGAALIFWAVSRLVSTRWGLRWALCVFLGGLLAYNYLALGLPGATDWIADSAGAFGVLVLTFAGQLLGALGAWVWMQVLSGPTSREG